MSACLFAYTRSPELVGVLGASVVVVVGVLGFVVGIDEAFANVLELPVGTEADTVELAPEIAAEHRPSAVALSSRVIPDVPEPVMLIASALPVGRLVPCAIGAAVVG